MAAAACKFIVRFLMSFSTTSFCAEIPEPSLKTAMSKSGICWI